MKERSTRCPPKLRILSALLAFAMLLTLLPVTAFAANVTRREIDGLKYVQVNNYQVLWITGTYTGSATHLTLENRIDGLNVNRIYGYEGDSLFKNNQTLKRVTLPTNDYFYEIGEEAFAGCTNLETVDAPTTLGDVGKRAFQGCTKLKSLALGSNSSHIYESAFEGCTSLKSIEITGTMVYIDGTAFKGCTNLTSVILPKYLEEMGNNVFEGCTSLEEITLPKDIREFGDNVFAGCTNLKKITYKGKPTDWENCPAKEKIPANVKVEFAVPLTEYDISVCGTKANEANYANMLGDNKVEFVPTSNYLILNNANVSYNDATTAAIDSTLNKLVVAGNGKDTIENTGGTGIKTTGELVLRSSHIIVKGTPAISAQSIVVHDDDYWYRTAANGTFVKSTGTVAIGNADYFELIESKYNPNEPNGIFLWIKDKRMPELNERESYDVFDNGTVLLEEKVDDLSGGMHCTLYLKDANLESADTAIQTMVDQLTIIGTGTIKGGKKSLLAEINRENYYYPEAKVRIEDSNLTFTGGLDLDDGAEIINSTVTVNDWSKYGIEASSELIIDGSNVTIASETREYALCPWGVKVKENSTLRLQGAKSAVIGGDKKCTVDAENYWYRTSPDDEFTKGTKKEFQLDKSYTYYELTTIDPDAVTYDLWVAGKQVTETNQNDVLGDGGSVKFDPDTHTLTLSDAHLTLGEDAEGDVSGCIDSELAEELTITGTATLSNADGILTDGPLTLKNADLTLTGNNEDGGEEAIRAGRSDEDITIQNSKVTIAGTNAEGNFFNFGIRCGKLTVANSTLDVKVYGSAIEADELKASGAGTVITAETDSQNEEDYAIELNNENSLTMNDGLVLVEGEVNKSRKAKIAQPEQVPTGFKVLWVVRPGDTPQRGMQFPGAIIQNDDERHLFAGWFLEDGTRLEDSPYYMGPGVDHVDNIDRDVTFYGRWCTAEQLRTLTFEGGTVAVNSGLKIGYTAEESPVKLAPGSRVTLTLDESKAADHRFVIDPIPADWTTSGRTATFTMPDADTTVTVEQRAENPANYKVYWVVHPGDTPQRGMQIPGAIIGSEEEERLFEGWFLEDGTRLEDSPYYMGPGVDHVGNLDRDVTFYGHWRTAESGESGEGGGDGFGTLLAVGAVVGVAGVVAYQVGTELILDQLLPAGVAVPHTRAELAMLLWNTAGRPAPATLPAFADVADPELAQAAQWAIEQGYLKARADGSFKPDKGVAKWRVIRGYRAVTEP